MDFEDSKKENVDNMNFCKDFASYHGHGQETEPRDWRISMIQPDANGLSPPPKAKRYIGQERDRMVDDGVYDSPGVHDDVRISTI